MSNLSIIKALSQLVEEQNELIGLLSAKLKEAGVICNTVEDTIQTVHDKYIAILGAGEVPDNLS